MTALTDRGGLVRIVLIVQARMGSTRLPGKVLAPILGRPMLEIQLERLGRARTPSKMIVATSDLTRDDVIAEVADRLGIGVYRGSEADVLARFAGAARATKADVVVRTTADCPLIDPGIVDKVVNRLLSERCEYASNTLDRTFPRGLDVEAVTRSALLAADLEARDPVDREHVTVFIYRQPHRFRLCSVVGIEDRSQERWTVDTREDLEFVRRIIETLYPINPEFVADDVIKLLNAHPKWREINARVEQKRTG